MGGTGRRKLAISTAEELQAYMANAYAALSSSNNGHTVGSDGTSILTKPGGKVIQQVCAYTQTAVTSNSSTWIDTTLQATITPKRADSQLLIWARQSGLGREYGTWG